MYIDSHCHPYMLDLKTYDNSMDNLIADTTINDVDALLSVGVDLITSKQCIELAQTYEYLYASVGSHPSYPADLINMEDELTTLADNEKVIAIGETGLDYYHSKDNLDQMRDGFRAHIRIAKQVQKPLIIHTRDARRDTIEIMAEEGACEAKGVMHCFTESLDMAQSAIEMGFYISFSGIITFKNATELQGVVQSIPLDKILIETDAPYLAPVPFRGKQNEPKYVRYVAEKIAQLKGESIETVAQVTSNNFCQLFGVSIA